jgi:phenylalanyl-tRNA synthetase beta chain
MAWVVEGLQVGPSPQWLQDELLALGLKPISNVVDITNWVMYQTGQPLHAFDADCLQGNTLAVRWAHTGETLQTLDGTVHTLGATHLVIADAHQALALAGVMGGQAAQVSATTQRIVLESAYFDPATIRASSRALGLSTDSAYRFARDVDPAGVLLAAQQALALLADCAGGRCTAHFAGGAPLPCKEPIVMHPGYISQRLGFEVPTPVLRDQLQRLGFEIHEQASDQQDPDGAQSPDTPQASVLWQVQVPSHKRDVHRPIDLVEECLRLLGTHNIPQAPVTLSLPQLPQPSAPQVAYLERAATYLQDQHAAECYHHSLQSHDELQAWLGHPSSPSTLQALALHNPLTAEHTHLRSSLLPGLIRTWGYNQDHGNTQRRYFETGHVFVPTAQGVQETLSVAFLLQAQSQERSWMPAPRVDFFKAQSLMIGLLRLLLGGAATLPPAVPLQGHAAFAPDHASSWGELMEQGFEGRLGFLSLDKMRGYSVRTPLLIAELLVRPDYWDTHTRAVPSFRPYSTYPCIRKDLCLLVPCETLGGTVTQDLQACANKAMKDSQQVLESIKVFDCFESENLPKGKKSITFELLFRAQDRTLSDTEVNRYLQDLHECITHDTPYHIRSL